MKHTAIIIVISIFLLFAEPSKAGLIPLPDWYDLSIASKQNNIAERLDSASQSLDLDTINRTIASVLEIVSEPREREFIIAYQTFFRSGYLEAEDAFEKLSINNDDSYSRWGRLVQAKLLVARGNIIKAKRILASVEKSFKSKNPSISQSISYHLTRASIAIIGTEYPEAKSEIDKANNLLSQFNLPARKKYWQILIEIYSARLLAARYRIQEAHNKLVTIQVNTPAQKSLRDEVLMLCLSRGNRSENIPSIRRQEVDRYLKLLGEKHLTYLIVYGDELLEVLEVSGYPTYAKKVTSYLSDLENALGNEVKSYSQYWFQMNTYKLISAVILKNNDGTDRIELIKSGVEAIKLQFGTGSARHAQALAYLVAQLADHNTGKINESEKYLKELDLVTAKKTNSIARAKYHIAAAKFLAFFKEDFSKAVKHSTNAVTLLSLPENYGHPSVGLIDSLDLLLDIRVRASDQKGAAEAKEELEKSKKLLFKPKIMSDNEVEAAIKSVNNAIQRGELDTATTNLFSLLKSLDSERIIVEESFRKRQSRELTVPASFLVLKIGILRSDLPREIRSTLSDHTTWSNLQSFYSEFIKKIESEPTDNSPIHKLYQLQKIIDKLVFLKNPSEADLDLLARSYRELKRLQRASGFPTDISMPQDSFGLMFLKTSPKTALSMVMTEDMGIRNTLANSLELRSEEDVENTLELLEEWKMAWIGILAEHLTENKAQVTHCCELLIDHKSMLRNIIYAYRTPPREKNQEFKGNWERLAKLRTELKQLVFDQNMENKKSANAHFQRLKAEIKQLERKLITGRSASKSNKPKDKPPTFKDLQAAIPLESMVVDYVLYFKPRPASLKEMQTEKGVLVKFSNEKYLGAFVYSKSEPPRFVKLGQAKVIEQKIQEWEKTNRHTLPKGHPIRLFPSRATALIETRGRLERELYSLIWAPLWKSHNHPSSVIISADGDLHRLSFVCLRDSKNVPVLEHLTSLSYLNSLGSSFEDEKSHNESRINPPLFVAINNDGRSLVLEYPEDSASQNAKKLRITRKIGYEALLGSNASFNRVINALSSNNGPLLVDISCHGYSGRWPIPEPKYEGMIEVPHVCALFLWGDKNKIPLSDCLFLGSDIASCNLSSTQVVVLQSCQVGTGRIVPSQGMRGLRDAFLIAGASSVVAPVASVGDEATANLMGLFYDELPGDPDSFSTKSIVSSLFTAMRKARKSNMTMKMQDDSTLWGLFVVETKSPPSS